MKKSIILHIGIGKTATTAIQKFLYDEREQLEKIGIYVPLTGLAKNHFGHHLLANFQETEVSDQTKAIFSDFMQELSTVTASTILISSENFCYCKPKYVDFMKHFFEDFDVKIVFFVREQVRLVESTYLLWQTQGYDYRYNIIDFFQMAKGAFNYLWTLRAWMETFGNEHIVVKVYDRALYQNDIIHYFFSGIIENLDSCKSTKSEPLVNASLLPCYSELLSYFDTTFPDLLQPAFSETRNEIVQRFFSISETSISHEQMRNTLLGIADMITHTLDHPDIRIELVAHIMDYIKSVNTEATLITPSLKNEILDYYKDSNITFADLFLKGEERHQFLKNHIEHKKF